MTESTQGTWFYSKNGVQEGPVTFAELQAQAREGALNPRTDLAWTSGMADWKPTGEIEDLFEKRVTLPPPTPTPPAANPYQSPAHKESFELNTENGSWPGARRRTFYLMTMVFPFVWNFLFAIGAVFIAQQFGADIAGIATTVAFIVPIVLSIYYSLERLANVGMSRWWYLVLIVPIINIWVIYRIYVCPAGYAVHKKLDSAGTVLAIFFWLIFAFFLLMVVGIVLVMLGMVGDPEMLKQMEEAFRPFMEEITKP